MHKGPTRKIKKQKSSDEEKMKKKEMNAVLSNSTLRRYVLLTFSHVESQFLDKSPIVSRLRKTFTCQTIVGWGG